MSCDHCYQGYAIEGEPHGQLVGDAYFAPAPKSADDEGAQSCAVVLLTDIFGLALKNPKIIADELAQRIGCDVWVPDLFEGACMRHARGREAKDKAAQASRRSRSKRWSPSCPTPASPRTR